VSTLAGSLADELILGGSLFPSINATVLHGDEEEDAGRTG
jgi:hypothetical protein